MFRVEEITRAWANDLGIDVENSLKLMNVSTKPFVAI